MLHGLTRRDVEGERRIDSVVEEGDESEVFEAAEGGRKRAADVGVGEINGGDRAGDRVAKDAIPVAGSVISGVPGRERKVRVGERELNLMEKETFLVERESQRRRIEKEEDDKSEKHGAVMGREMGVRLACIYLCKHR